MENLNKKYSRKEFLKLAGITTAGFLLASWGFSLEKDENKAAKLNPSDRDVVFITKDHAQYESLRQGFNKRVQKYPRVIALCYNTNGVRQAVIYAAKNKLPVAVKSGGHCFEGFSCNDDGLVINLSLMNKVEWLDKFTIKVGPGCRLAEIYNELLPKRRIIPTGSCGGVGIGGLALGGGYGFFSRKYGLTCDSLLQVTFVDGQGTVHSSDDDPDLLWAFRGGGNGNFGVVTEMVFKTSPAPDTFQSHRFKVANLSAARAKIILQTWFEVAPQLPDSCFSAYVLNGNKLMILVTNYEEHTPALQKLLDALSAVTDKTTIGLPRELSKTLKNFYGVQTPLYFKNSSAGLYKNFSDISDVIEPVLDIVVNRPGIIYQVNTLGGNIAKAEFKNVSSYPYRDHGFVSELQTYWGIPGGEETLIKRFNEIQALFQKNKIQAHYVNYPNLDFEDGERSYYGSSYEKLQAIKRKYDGKNTIHHDQSVKI